MVRRSGDHRIDLAEAEPEDVEVVDGMLNQATASGLGGVGPPAACDPVGALNREVLVVPEHGRHWRTQVSALHKIWRARKTGSTAQDQAALAGDACAAHCFDERWAGGGPGPRRAASRRTGHDRRPVPRPPQPCAPKSACRPRRHRSATPLRPHRTRERRTAEDVGKPTGARLDWSMDRHDLRIDDATIDEGLEAQAMRPRNEGRDRRSRFAARKEGLGGGPGRRQSEFQLPACRRS